MKRSCEFVSSTCRAHIEQTQNNPLYRPKRKRVIDRTDSRICHAFSPFCDIPIQPRTFVDGAGAETYTLVAGNLFPETSFATREPSDGRVLVAPFPGRPTILPNSTSIVTNNRQVYPYFRRQLISMGKNDEVRPTTNSVSY